LLATRVQTTLFVRELIYGYYISRWTRIDSAQLAVAPAAALFNTPTFRLLHYLQCRVVA
jgi:hypothetical protein